MTSAKDEAGNPVDGAEDTPIRSGVEGDGKGRESASHGGAHAGGGEKTAVTLEGRGAAGTRPGAVASHDPGPHHAAGRGALGASSVAEAAQPKGPVEGGLQAGGDGAAAAAAQGGGLSSNNPPGSGAFGSIKKAAQGAAVGAVSSAAVGVAGGLVAGGISEGVTGGISEGIAGGGAGGG